MSAKARARFAAQWLPVVLFLGFIAVAAVVTNAPAASKTAAIVNVAAGGSAVAPQSIVVAALTQPPAPPAAADPVAAPVATPTLRGSIAPIMSTTPAPAPARFFTINEVLAKHAGGA